MDGRLSSQGVRSSGTSGEPVDDASLVDRWRGGDRQACKALFERHFAAVSRFFRNKVRVGEEDLVQMTFLRCFEAISRLDRAIAFRSFLFGIACNTLREHYRRCRRDGERRGLATISGYELAAAAELGRSLTSLLDQQQEHRLLLEALRRLPVEHQIILELHYWERMTMREIAEVTTTPEGTVKTRMRRGRQLLQEALVELAASPALVESTRTDLERWAETIRGALTEEPPGEGALESAG